MDDVQYETYIHIEESEEISSCTRLKDARMGCTAEMHVRGKNVKERLRGARLRYTYEERTLKNVLKMHV